MNCIARTAWIGILVTFAAACSGNSKEEPSNTPTVQEQATADLPVTLSESFRGYFDCVVIDYPVDWRVEHASGLGESYPAGCARWPQSGTTAVVANCEREIESEVESEVIFIKGPGERIVGGPGAAPYASLKHYQESCPDLDREIRRWGGQDAQELTINQVPARCYESTHQWMDEPKEHSLICFFWFEQVLYGFFGHSLETDWVDVGPKVRAMRDSLRMTPFPICGSPDFPPQHAHFCPQGSPQ